MKLVAATLALALPLLAPAAALADTYPSRPITMIVVFAPGGPTDVLARIVADHMGRTIGQRIVIENLAGAGGTTGGARGAKAEPGRLHADGRQPRQPRRRGGAVPEHPVRCPRARADRAHRRHARLFRRAQGFPGPDDAGVPGACEGEPRQGHERPCRRRLDAASRLPLPRPSDRHEPRLDAVSRLGAGHERPRRRADRFDVRPCARRSCRRSRPAPSAA